MSIGVLSGKVDNQTIEVVFEISYSPAGVENTYSIGGLSISQNANGGNSFGFAGYNSANTSNKTDLKVMTFDNFQRDGEGRWAKHEIIGVDKKPILEFLGPDLETISFSVYLSTTLGIDPVTELKKLRQLRDAGAICTFTLGGNMVTTNFWVVAKLDEAHTKYDGSASLLNATVNVSLTEYPKLPKEE